MVKVNANLRQELLGCGKWPDFVDACARAEERGVKGKSSIIDDAIDEVCPELSKYKNRKTVKQFEAKVERRGSGIDVGDARCNGFRMLEWVVENYERKDVGEWDAPSSAAWSIFKAAKRDDDTYRDVMKKYIDAKLKIDASQGDTETRRLDGQAEYDLLEGLSAEDLA